jgi:hypothetical protein
MYCKTCGNTERGTVAHLSHNVTGPDRHAFAPFAAAVEIRAIKAAEAILQAAGTSLRHYMPLTRLQVIDTAKTILEG